MTGSRMAMSSDFLAAFAKLPSQQQRLVRAMNVLCGQRRIGVTPV